ncbi:MAG: DEAD/DEAH box helicase [Bdellovibrionales bacterium]
MDFIVSTPGRLIDLYKENIVDLKQVRGIVFDEADRMFDMGFKDDMRYLLERIPRDRQYLCFSATLDFEVLNTAYEFGSEPIEVSISKDEPTADNVEDKIFHVGVEEKPQYLLSLLKKHKPRQAIVFTNFKHNVDRVADFLNKNNVKAQGISSLLSQKQRTRVMEWFRSAEDLKVMVATDVAARGLDIKGVDLVINFEGPDEASTYVHRIGRTGRAEATGLAYSLVSDRDIPSLSRVEKYLDNKLEVGWLDDTDLVSEYEGFPREAKSRRLRDSMDKRKRESDKRRKPYQGSKGKRPSGGQSSNKPKPPRNANNRRHEEGETENRPTHRDRRSGRHQKSAENSAQPKQAQNKKSNRRPQKSKKHRVRTSANKSVSAKTNSPPKSVGGKVKAFF